jgi:TetR/AcrR family transcriptional regulator
VQRLEQLVASEVRALSLAPAAELRALDRALHAVYAGAQHEHRVLTEDVKFLGDERDAARCQAAQKRVVAAFAHTIERVRPDLSARNCTRRWPCCCSA